MSQIIGFGMLDAEAMVSKAVSWTLVGQQFKCSSFIQKVNKKVYVFFFKFENKNDNKEKKCCKLKSYWISPV